MSLNEKILEDIKNAMRAKEADKLSVLRMLNASLKNKMISLRDGESVALTDEQIQEVIASEVKKRRDSAAEYRNAGRNELAEKEEVEVGVLEVYLPAQLSDAELEAGVKAIVEAAEKKEFGLLMKEVMAKFKGQADGRRVGEAIKKILG
jgi:uncharacterized protein YqeY